MKKLFTLVMSLPMVGFSQFADIPESGNSTAIFKDSSVFVSWATGCTVQRGKQNISNPNSALVNHGSNNYGIGSIDGQVVSLGDSGVAILTFETPITNGAGPDFAVFENSFNNTFLELAFVEVSSDGNNYFRFPATCNLDPNTQVGSFGSSDLTKINNLAGKYRANYGTPFDLDSIPNEMLLDKNSITHVKLVDVIGNISGNHTSYDRNNNPVNDPFPTEFSSGGFDLDGIGVIHEQQTDAGIENLVNNVSVYPNPVIKGQEIHISSVKSFEKIQLIDIFGNLVAKIESDRFSTEILSSGIYFVQFEDQNGRFSKKVLVK